MDEARGFPMDALAARRFGGRTVDYEAVRLWFEKAESYYPDGRGRLLVVHSFGIFLCEQTLGPVIVRESDTVAVPVRPIAEAYVMRVLRGKIPTVEQSLHGVRVEPWMSARARPLSQELHGMTAGDDQTPKSRI